MCRPFKLTRTTPSKDIRYRRKTLQRTELISRTHKHSNVTREIPLKPTNKVPIHMQNSEKSVTMILQTNGKPNNTTAWKIYEDHEQKKLESFKCGKTHNYPWEKDT